MKESEASQDLIFMYPYRSIAGVRAVAALTHFGIRRSRTSGVFINDMAIIRHIYVTYAKYVSQLDFWGFMTAKGDTQLFEWIFGCLIGKGLEWLGLHES